MTPGASARRIRVGLEEGPSGAVRAHAFSLPGCAATGPDAERALESLAGEVGEWLHFLERRGSEVPPRGELELSVDEWVSSHVAVAEGEGAALFEDDLRPLDPAEVAEGLQRLGDLRGLLLAAVRGRPAERLAVPGPAGWSPARILDELARAQWWTLTRLGASPLAELPGHVTGRLDTAMALVVQQLTAPGLAARTGALEIDGEGWTPRKVLRRLLWLEWSLGASALRALEEDAG